MRLIPRNDRARQERSFLESISHLPTHGVSVSIGPYKIPECFGDGEIRLPEGLFQSGKERELILVWRHELQHARDFLDNSEVIQEACAQDEEKGTSQIQKILDRMEKRADRAEHHSGLGVDPHWETDRGV